MKAYTCENCGGSYEWSIEKQKLVCTSCGDEKAIDNDSKIKEYTFNEAELKKAEIDWGNALKTCTCSGCGNVIELPEMETVAQCIYCGADYVVESRQRLGIKPEAIIRFVKTKDDVADIFRKWVKGRIFAPNALRLLYQKDKLVPMYIPYWTYDANAEAFFAGEGGTVYFVTVERDGKRYQERRVRWTAVSGRVERFFDDIMVNASPRNADLVNRSGNFSTQSAVPFLEDYLPGYITEKYTLKPKEGFETAKQIMRDELNDMARDQILTRYDEARVHKLSPSYADVKFKHILTPIWASGYFYNGKHYSFVVNGQTGRIAGDYPISPVKVAIAVVLGVLLLIGAYIAYSFTEDAEYEYEYGAAYAIVCDYDGIGSQIEIDEEGFEWASLADSSQM